MRRFDETRYYVTTDPELELLGTRDALAKQRSRREGPRYHKVGKRILYRGDDLNEYLDSCVVEPATRRESFASAASSEIAEHPSVKGGEKPDQRAEQNTATATVGVRWSEGVGIRLEAAGAGNAGRA